MFEQPNINSLAASYAPYYHYARGSMWADMHVRRDPRRTSIRDELSRECHNSIDFWRGLFDHSGSLLIHEQPQYKIAWGKSNGKRVRMESIPGKYQPLTRCQISFPGSPMYLAAFAEWTYANSPDWVDPQAQMLREILKALRNNQVEVRMVLKDKTARSVVNFYWPNDDVLTTETHRKRAADVRAWLSRKELHEEIMAKIVSYQLIRRTKPVIKRVAYANDLAEVYRLANIVGNRGGRTGESSLQPV